jgi:uncharacterized protein YndB with AHSA1/START domain
MDLDLENLEPAVRRTIALGVDRAAAWSRLADAAGLRSWLAEEVDLEIRPGARGTIRLAEDDTRLVEVEEVELRRRVSLVWRKPDGEPSLVELTLDDIADGTQLTVIEMPLLTLRALAVSVEEQSSAGRGPAMFAAAT